MVPGVDEFPCAGRIAPPGHVGSSVVPLAVGRQHTHRPVPCSSACPTCGLFASHNAAVALTGKFPTGLKYSFFDTGVYRPRPPDAWAVSQFVYRAAIADEVLSP